MSDDKNQPSPPVEDIDCLEAINGLYAWLDGEMTDAEELARFEHHLGHCRSCFSRRELELALSERIKRETREQTPKRIKKRLKNLIEKF